MSETSLKTIPVLLGPTASGKTAVGIELAKLLDGEIISVDSRKVYKGLPIGTATPKGRWIHGAYYIKDIPHHLMAFLPPDEPYTAGDFAKDATQLIFQIQKRNHIPILVGGTGFYFKALQQGLPTLPTRDQEIRDHYQQKIGLEGVGTLYDELQKQDPVAAQKISKYDRHKIIRALEVMALTKKPYSTHKKSPAQQSPFSFTVMALQYDKEDLDKRIERRSKNMMERGMIREAEEVLLKGYPKDCAALSSFGYKEAIQVIEGTLPEKEFLPLLIKGTKAYAKRQRTWFRTQTQPTWFECDSSSQMHHIALKMKDFLY